MVALVVLVASSPACAPSYSSVLPGDISFEGPVDIQCELYGTNTKKAAKRIAEWYAGGWRIAYSIYRVTEGSSSRMRVCYGRKARTAKTATE